MRRSGGDAVARDDERPARDRGQLRRDMRRIGAKRPAHQVEPPPVLAAQREPEQDFAAAAHGKRVGKRAFDDFGGQRLDMFGAPARQAAAMLAIEVEILVQRDEGELPRGAQPEIIILDPEQPGVIAAERLGHARAIEETGADIVAIEQPFDRADARAAEFAPRIVDQREIGVSDVGAGLRYLILPVIALLFVEIATLTRMVRASTLEVLRQDYVVNARSKGLPEGAVIRRHVVKNAFAPTMTLMGLILGSLLGGVAVIETVFTLPGLGRFLVDGIYARDYAVVQGVLLFVAFVHIVVNLVVDLLYPVVDPRVRF